ncbi:unnamed protein product [Gulo gulo]|uniref:Uncharacterized protein n=1 Tax=Gulo gulo TaxID=48420 RepID=A0A9X9M5K8_GULGU|nr:unnamed protein product [Gulo gulo]
MFTTPPWMKRGTSWPYVEDATLMWDGYPISRQKSQSEFFSSGASWSFHVSTVYCQPMRPPETDGQMNVFIVIYKTVKFEGCPPLF